MPKISVSEFQHLIEAEVQPSSYFGIETVSIEPGRAVLRMPAIPATLRPGPSVSGPAMMCMADLAMWAVVLAGIGRVEMCVTTNLHMNFLRAAGNKAVIAEATILKQGKRLAVTEVTITPEGSDDPVAHATATYSIPPAT